MLHAPQGANLAAEARLRLGVAGAQQALERNLPSKRRLPGAVDRPHAALAQLAEQLELAEHPPRRRRLLAGRLLGLRTGCPLVRLLLRHRHAQHAGQERALLAAEVRTVYRPPGGVGEVLGPLPAAAGVEEQRLLRLGVVQEQRVQAPQHRGISRGRRVVEVDALAVGHPGRLGARHLQRLDAAGALAVQLVALHQPNATHLPHLGDV
jgi:hypothetical protein